MKLSELKPGDWCECGPHYPAMYVGQDLQEGHLNIARMDGDYITLDCFLGDEEPEVTPLPDCTGWNWQPPEPAPQYRPFANAEEFKPHRDRWIRNISNTGAFKIDAYKNEGVVYGETFRVYKHMLETFRFDDDGSPCGVKL